MTQFNFGKILGQNNSIVSSACIKIIDTYRFNFNLHEDITQLPKSQFVASLFHHNNDKVEYTELACLLDDEEPVECSIPIVGTLYELCNKNKKLKRKNALFLNEAIKTFEEILEEFDSVHIGSEYFCEISESSEDKESILALPHHCKGTGCVCKTSLEIQALNLCNDEDLEIQGFVDEKISSILSQLNTIMLKYDIKSNLLGIFENCFILTYSLMRSQQRSDMVLAVINFYKGITKSNLVESKYVQKAVQYITQLFSEEDMERQALSKLDIRSLLSNYSRFKKSQLFKRVEKIYMYCLSHALLESFNITFEKKGYTEFEAMAIKRKHENYPDMLYDVLDTSLFIIETVDQYIRTGNYKDMLFGIADVETWIDRCYDIELKSKHLSNPEAVGFNIYSYLADLRIAIEQGETLLKHDTGADKTVVKRLVHSMKRLDMEYKSHKTCQKNRKAPFIALIEGPSSIGKSSFKDILRYHYAKQFNLPDDDEHTYTRIFQDEFWSGFGSHMWCLILDDIAFMRADKQPNGDQSLNEVIQIGNNVALCPPQAALEDKGKTPFLGRLVVASTNTLGLGAEEHFRCPVATLRRFHLPVCLTLKKEYTDLSTGFLDPHKLPESDPELYDDFWHIEVMRVVPESKDNRSSRGKFQSMLKFDNIYDFLAYFSKRVKEHEEQQERVLNSDDHKKGITICKDCYYPEKLCKCIERQTDEHDLSSALIDPNIVIDENETTPLRVMKWKYERFLMGREDERIISKQRLSDDCVEQTFDHVPTNVTMDFEIGQLSNWMEYTFYPLKTWLSTFLVFLFQVFVYRFMWGFVVGPGANLLSYVVAWFVANDFLLIYTDPIFSWFQWFFHGVWFRNWRLMGYYWFAKFCARRLVKQVRETYAANRYLTNVAMAISMFLFASQLYRKSQEKAHPERAKFELSEQDEELLFDGEVDEGIRPSPKNEVTESVWYKDQFHLSQCDLTETILSKCSQHTFFNRIAHNTFIFKTRFVNNEGVKRERVNRALGLRGNLYVSNFHGVHVREDGSMLIEISDGVDQGVSSRNVVVVPNGKWFRPPKSDLIFMEIKGRPPVKDITSFFSLHTLNTMMNGKYVIRELDGSISLLDVYKIEKIQHKDPNLDECMDIWMGSVNHNTIKGECGSPMIAETELGRFILGIHLLGGPGKVGAIRISLEDIIIAEQKVCEYTNEAGYIHISAPGYARHLGDLNKKSIFRYLEKGDAKVFGSFQGFRTKPKSMVAKSLIHDELEAQGIESKWTRPVMGGWEPWRIAVEPIVKPKMEFDHSLLKKASEDYLSHIRKHVSEDDLNELCELDWYTTVNGADGVRFIDKVNRSTSAGAPFKKSKKFFAHPLDEDENKIEFDEVIMGECKVIISKYRSGEQYHPIFTGALKDEPVTWKKFHDKKTRMFAGSPLPWSLVVRKYLLSFIRLFQKNSFIFEGMVGVNCHSKDWEEIRKYLTEFGYERMIAGDFKAFDKGMFAEFILEAFKIIKDLHVGRVDPTHLHIIDMIAMDIAYPVVDVNGDLVQFFGFNPSGQPLTVIINCIVHSLYMRYVFFKLERDMRKNGLSGPALIFAEHVKLATYGDDGASGVRDTVPWFTHTSIQSTLADIGIGYTMADKDSESIPYIHVDEVSFLKRTWKFDERFGCHVAPLELDSIFKSLMVSVVSRSIPRQEQMMATIRSALMEFFYHGKEVFDKYSALLKKIVDGRDDLIPFVNEHTFPLYDQLIYNFESAKQMLKYVASE